MNAFIGRPSRLVVAALVLGFSPRAVAAGVDVDADVEEYVKSQMERFHVPGVSVAVVRDGKPALARGYGLASVELSAAATPDTVYGILSVGKMFTATSVLLLAEKGDVGLDDPVRKHLPDLPAAWSEVTIRHLLSHTSGIPDYTDSGRFWETIRLDRTPRQVLEPVLSSPLEFRPGEKWRYSNSGYYVLGLLIEKLSGKSYSEFLSERIFGPLEMTETRVDDAATIVPGRASGYTWANDSLRNAEFVSPTQKWAAGAIVSSVADLAKWDAALLSERLLKRAALEPTWAPARLRDGKETGYGLGNEVGVDHGHRFAGHQGGGLAFNATMLRFVDDRLTVIVLANQTSAPSLPMARHIASLFLPEISDEKNTGIEDQDPALTETLKSVLVDAAEGKVDMERFTAAGRERDAKIAQRMGPTFLKPLGAMKSFTLLERRDDGAARHLRYRAVFGSQAMIWTFMIAADGKIESMEPMME